MNVLSLFDGISCGQQALERSGIKVDNYFASEIDKYAIKVTMSNYPGTIQLGNVVNVKGLDLPKIDLLIGGSPCQSFSFAGRRNGMTTKCETEILTLEHYLELKNECFEFEGQSYLFWEFMRLLNETKPKYFLLENVEMGEKWEKVLSRAIGVNGIHINSALVSAQNRKRIYWTNIGMQPGGLFGDLESIIKQPKDKGILLKDILEENVPDKYILSEKYITRLKINLQVGGNEVINNKCIINTINKHIDKLENGTMLDTYNKEIHKDKSIAIRARVDASNNTYIVHNLQPRSGDPKKGGTGTLSRKDGKTYCLDAQQANAVEIIERRINPLNVIDKSNLVFQLNDSKESYNKQPYQQNRVYDINGISPALQSTLGSGSSIINASKIRKLTPIECERLQTIKDNYTNYVSDSQRYKMIGNGWTVEVISHFFNYIK